MKALNLILIGLFAVLLSSCSTDSDGGDAGFDPDNCDMGNGIMTATISGSSDYRLPCAVGGYTEIQGVKVLSVVNLNIPDVSQSSIIYDDYLAMGVSLPSTISSGCISDSEDLSSGSITYWEDITLDIGQEEELEDHPGFYQAFEEDVEICFDELTAERAVGTFSGTLRNNFGDTKAITDGRFDFKF